MVPDFAAALCMGRFELSKIELQLVAHGDGDYYRRHIDTQTGDPADRSKHQRVITGVYYFHAVPKAFSGGALRLTPVMPPREGEGEGQFTDIEPEHNSLLLFPSFAAHEVRPVSCPSGRFRDSRFAINCWMCRRSAPAVARA